MIIQVCQNQPELTLRIVQPGCNGGQLLDYTQLRLVIRAPECKFLLKSPIYREGCWLYNPPGEHEVPPHELPAIIYEGFDCNDKREVVFRFDSLMWKLPPGRYFGYVEYKDGTPITKVDLDLCTIPFIVDKATLNSPRGCL